MPKTKKTSAPAADNPESPLLEKAARAVGATLGTLATKTGLVTSESGPRKKSRLPRKVKKKLKAQSASKA